MVRKAILECIGFTKIDMDQRIGTMSPFGNPALLCRQCLLLLGSKDTIQKPTELMMIFKVCISLLECRGTLLTPRRKAASDIADIPDRSHNRSSKLLESEMPQTTRRVVLACALALAATPALAEDAVYTSTFSNVAVSGYDAVAYFTEGKPVEGSDGFTADHDGATWRFASAANRDAFLEDPVRFAPQYGGYCAWAVSQGYTASTDPEAWKIVDDKLYLNYSKSVQSRWEQDIPGNIEKGDVNWPSVLD